MADSAHPTYVPHPAAGLVNGKWGGFGTAPVFGLLLIRQVVFRISLGLILDFNHGGISPALKVWQMARARMISATDI